MKRKQKTERKRWVSGGREEQKRERKKKREKEKI